MMERSDWLKLAALVVLNVAAWASLLWLVWYT